jgi:hypothetical protein
MGTQDVMSDPHYDRQHAAIAEGYSRKSACTHLYRA